MRCKSGYRDQKTKCSTGKWLKRYFTKNTCRKNKPDKLVVCDGRSGILVNPSPARAINGGGCMEEDDGYPKDSEIEALQKKGHTFHCAMRILTGDGECECDKKDHIPGLISRSMYAGRCLVCLGVNSHKDWCRNK